MSTKMEVKRWTANRRNALLLEIIRGKTAVAAASCGCDIAPSEIEEGVNEAERQAGHG